MSTTTRTPRPMSHTAARWAIAAAAFALTVGIAFAVVSIVTGQPSWVMAGMSGFVAFAATGPAWVTAARTLRQAR